MKLIKIYVINTKSNISNDKADFYENIVPVKVLVIVIVHFNRYPNSM